MCQSAHTCPDIELVIFSGSGGLFLNFNRSNNFSRYRATPNGYFTTAPLLGFYRQRLSLELFEDHFQPGVNVAIIDKTGGQQRR